jgi:hypothetical protein
MVLGGDTRNVEKLGAYVAWLINNRLFSDYVERTSEDAMTRVRMQSSTGADFLATELHGELQKNSLTDIGRRFTEYYLLSERYDKDFQEIEFEGDNEWVRYTELAPLISASFRNFQSAGKPTLGKKLAKVLRFPGT